MSILFYL